MSWRDHLRPGSWRGAPFKIQEHEAEGGRRGEQHEFPGRDLPWFEDIGSKAKRFSVTAIVVNGPDYIADRDRLLAACDIGGPGILVHPFFGSLQVVCETYACRETTEQGGAAFFTFEFAEAGAILPPEAAIDTGAAVDAAAETARTAAPAAFASSFSVQQMPAWVGSGAIRLINRLTAATVTAGLFLGGSGSALRAFEVGLTILPKGALALLQAPLQLGHAVAGLIAAVAGLSDLPARRIAALRAIVADINAAPAVIGATPARLQQARNQVAFQKLVTTLAAAEIVQEAAASSFASYDEAVATRDTLADELDALALAYADSGDDIGAASIDQVRRSMVRDITARGGSLARLYGYVPAATEPAVVIAHRLYGDPPLVIDQADDIVARNRVAHPGFVPGGRRLEVRTNG